MLRKAARDIVRKGEAISTGLVSHAKKQRITPRGDGVAKVKAEPFLTRPALVQGFAEVPPEPKFLGLAGVLPFLMLAPPITTGLTFLPADFVSKAATLQIGYGASIASFLGAMHWALAMANYGSNNHSPSLQDNTDRYIWSVMPCLLAWPALSMQPGPASAIVGCAIGAAYVVDRSFAKRSLLPPWYMVLRLPLTLAAMGGLGMTCVSSLYSNVPNKGPAVSPEREQPQNSQ